MTFKGLAVQITFPVSTYWWHQHTHPKFINKQEQDPNHILDF